MKDKYVWLDINGFPYNAKYPPNPTEYGNKYHGYRTYEEESFFYEFAVQYYDLSFRYNGNYYYIMIRGDHAYVTDESFVEERESFPDGNTLIEQFRIEGHPLISIIPQIDDIDFF
jgi:hypothetical protein